MDNKKEKSEFGGDDKKSQFDKMSKSSKTNRSMTNFKDPK